jgi:Skp family chaperone for outer membrane proteins
MKMKLHHLLAAVLVSAFALPAFAQNTNTPNIDQRQANQQRRIANGIKTGELTAREAQHLEKREAKIDADKQAAKADGKVTRAERRKLQREENRASRAIYRKKHNGHKA